MQAIEAVLEACHSELSFDFIRAAGPGGQNVNKVATGVQLRFNLLTSAALPEAAKRRLARLAGRRLNSEGILVIEARRFRSQEQNREDAEARFESMVRRSMEEPKHRLPTKATLASRERRLATKKRRGEIKRARQNRSEE